MGNFIDKYNSVRFEAEKLIIEQEINALPIDPFKIARNLDIELKPLPSIEGGASGMLLYVGGEFGIAYPTRINNEGFIRFSVAHEIGHYRLPGHIEAIFDGKGKHISQAGFLNKNRYELEADHFAAVLLMPKKFFISAAKKAGTGMRAIKSLAEFCKTSLEATALRYVQTTSEPMAVIRSDGLVIDYVFMSSSLMDFSGLEWIQKGTPLPKYSITYEFNTKRGDNSIKPEDKGNSEFQDWFDGPHQQEILEEVIHLGQYGKSLTILSEIELQDEIEDEEQELLESWKPRFK